MTAPGFHEEDPLTRRYDGRLARRLVSYVRPYGWLVAVATVLLFIEGALQLVGPALTRRVIDEALPARDAALVRTAAWLYLASLVLQFACSYGETVLTALLGQRVMRDLRLQLFEHLQRLPVPFFDRNPVGRLITRVTSDVEALNELFTAGVVSGIGDLFTLVAIAVMMFIVDWRLALAALIIVPLVYLTSHLFQSRVRLSYREIRTRLARINAFLQERLTGMRVVQLFNQERREAARFDRLNRDHLGAHLRSITLYALYFPAIEVLTALALASLLVGAAGRVDAGTVTVGVVAQFLMLVRRFFQPLQDLSDKFNTLQQAMASSERIFLLLDTPAPGNLSEPATISSTRSPLPAAVPWSADRAPRPVSVEFEDVWFAYDRPHSADGSPASGEPEWVLQGVSFRVNAGQTIALVGHTGAGKTTIVNLLMRFYDPQRGRITVNGTDVRELPLDELRSLIGYVQQDIFLFAGDVRTNIRLASPLSDAGVEAAARAVGADTLIRRLPAGYAHELGERGQSLSVGERQLLSFARAVAADPAVLLLDEATSAVDSEIEAGIQDALSTLMAGRTTLAVAHRLSTITGADEILVLNHGQVAERGTHRALLARRGLYERLYRLQSGDTVLPRPAA